MRLINVRTLELEELDPADDWVKYAILSHRWVAGEEVSFEDFKGSDRQWMPGWAKITSCCHQALRDGLDYAWVDTCCINKDSSAELSEAINSMFDWYAGAEVCYAYLNDVALADAAIKPIWSQIADSVWFTRAWTLQELVAPRSVIFYDRRFQRCGSKREMPEQVQEQIGIPLAVLRNPVAIVSYSVAARMSWAAKRQATRREDIAYSLFGIFEVNLPLLYGEGHRAFARLQEEIIRQSHDHSIFAWTASDEDELAYEASTLPLLAPRISRFRDCGDIYIRTHSASDMRPYAMTNIGLEIELLMAPYDLDVYLALTSCGTGALTAYAILLVKENKPQSTRFHRVRHKGKSLVEIDVLSSLHTRWQKMHIIRSPLMKYRRPGEVSIDRRISASSLGMLYGIRLLDSYSFSLGERHRHSYTLVARNDWTSTHTSKDTMWRDNNRRPLLDAIISGSSRFPHKSVKVYDMVSPESSPAMRGEGRGEDKPWDQRKPVGVFELPLGASGTAGVVYFHGAYNGVRALKVGLDFDFLPVVFLGFGEDTHPLWIKSRIENESPPFLSLHTELDRVSDSVTASTPFADLQPESLRSLGDLEVLEGGAIVIADGIFAFRPEASLNRGRWACRPDPEQSSYLIVELSRGQRANDYGWQLRITVREWPTTPTASSA